MKHQNEMVFDIFACFTVFLFVVLFSTCPAWILHLDINKDLLLEMVNNLKRLKNTPFLNKESIKCVREIEIGTIKGGLQSTKQAE